MKSNTYGAINGSEANSAKLARYQYWVFFVTFVAYANSHFSRKSYTQVKTQLESDAGMTASFLGGLDTMFMFSYAMGSFLMGNLGDRMRPAGVTGVGLWGSGVCVLLFAQGATTEFPVTSPTLALVAYQALWLVHGVFQSTGGPVNTAIMGAWFPAENRGLIFGLWTCHQYIGNIVSAFVAAAILSSPLDYWWNIVVAGVANVVWGTVLFFCTPSRPEEVGLALDGSSPSPVADEAQPEPISFGQALKIPGVSTYAIAFGFFKLVNYVIFFWLPFFLATAFNPETANMISSLYDVGMMPGGIIVGFVSDKFGGRRATVCSACFILLCPLLYVFANYGAEVKPWVLLIMLLFMGTFVGGPNNIITSAVAADLALNPAIGGNSRSLGTVTGIINGSGSIIAALGLLCIAPLESIYGWSAVWGMLGVSVILGCALLGGKIWSELTGPVDYQAPAKKKIKSVDSFNAFAMLDDGK